MERKNKRGSSNWRWEDDFEDGNRPKVKTGKKSRQQVRQKIRAGDFDELEEDEFDE